MTCLDVSLNILTGKDALLNARANIMKDLIPIKQIVVKARISICEKCELFRPKLRRCALPPKGCGCLIDTMGKFGKAHMMGQSCPHKKWQKMTTEDLIELHNQLSEGDI